MANVLLKRRFVVSLAMPLFSLSGAIWEPRCASTLNSPSDLIDRRHCRRLFDYSVCLNPREGGVGFLTSLISQLFFFALSISSCLFASFKRVNISLLAVWRKFPFCLAGANVHAFSFFKGVKILSDLISLSLSCNVCRHISFLSYSSSARYISEK